MNIHGSQEEIRKFYILLFYGHSSTTDTAILAVLFGCTCSILLCLFGAKLKVLTRRTGFEHGMRGIPGSQAEDPRNLLKEDKDLDNSRYI